MRRDWVDTAVTLLVLVLMVCIFVAAFGPWFF